MLNGYANFEFGPQSPERPEKVFENGHKWQPSKNHQNTVSPPISNFPLNHQISSPEAHNACGRIEKSIQTSMQEYHKISSFYANFTSTLRDFVFQIWCHFSNKKVAPTSLISHHRYQNLLTYRVTCRGHFVTRSFAAPSVNKKF